MGDGPISGRRTPRRALDVYVSDRNRTRTPHLDRDVERTSGAGERFPELTSPARSIPVPNILDFGRNAGTWRDRSSG